MGNMKGNKTTAECADDCFSSIHCEAFMVTSERECCLFQTPQLKEGTSENSMVYLMASGTDTSSWVEKPGKPYGLSESGGRRDPTFVRFQGHPAHGTQQRCNELCKRDPRLLAYAIQPNMCHCYTENFNIGIYRDVSQVHRHSGPTSITGFDPRDRDWKTCAPNVAYE